jgi:hypothetical protein
MDIDTEHLLSVSHLRCLQDVSGLRPIRREYSASHSVRPSDAGILPTFLLTCCALRWSCVAYIVDTQTLSFAEQRVFACFTGTASHLQARALGSPKGTVLSYIPEKQRNGKRPNSKVAKAKRNPTH